MVAQVFRQPDFLHTLTQALLHKGQESLQVLGLFIQSPLLLLSLEAQILGWGFDSLSHPGSGDSQLPPVIALGL